MSDSNFFGEYVAPAALLAGTGVSAYRTYKQMKGKGVLSQAWEAQKEQRLFLGAFQRGQTGRHFRSDAEIAQAFFFDSSKLGKTFASHPDAAPLRTAMDIARGHATENLIRSYGLFEQAARLGITPENPAGFSPDALEQLLKISPAHRQHMEILARNNGLIGDLGGGNADRVKNTLMEAAAQHRYDPTTKKMLRVSDLASRGDALEELSPRSMMRGIPWRRGVHFAPSTQMHMHMSKLHDTIKRMNQLGMNGGTPLKYQLGELTEAGKTQIATVRVIHGNETLVEIPIRQANGTARMGHYGQRRMIGRMVKSANFEQLVASGISDPAQLYRPAHEALIEGLYNGGLEEIVNARDKGARFMHEMIGHHSEETGRPFLPETLNQGLNRRLAHQVVLRDVPDPIISIHDKLINANQGWNPHEGLSPTQSVAGVRNLPNEWDRVWGASPVGRTGDNKTIAQAHRPKVLDRMVRGPSNVVMGKAQFLSGDQMTRVRTFNAPDIAFNTLLEAYGRGDIHLHEDEAILTDNIFFKERVAQRIPSTSFLSEKMEAIATGDNPFLVDLRSRLAEGIDPDEIRGNLETLRELLGYAKGPETQIELQEAIDAVSNLILKPGDVIGLNEAGGYARVPSNASEFIVSKMQFLSDLSESKKKQDGAGAFFIEGDLISEVDVDHKLFEDKYTVKAKMRYQEGRKLAAIQHMVSQSEEYQAALNLPNAEMQRDALYPLYKQHLDRLATYEMEHLAASSEYRGTGPQLKGAFAGTEYERAWSEALDATRKVQRIGVQGVKKIQERGMPAMVHGMVEELSAEAAQLEDRVPFLTYGTEEIPGLVDYQESEKSIRRFLKSSTITREQKTAAEWELSDIVEARRRREWELRDTNTRLSSIMGLGLEHAPEGAPGRYLLDEKRADNIIETFQKTIDLTVRRKGRGMWSAKKLFQDLSVADGLTERGREAFRKVAGLSEDDAADWFLKGRRAGFLGGPKNIRLQDAIMTAIEPQLRYATINRTMAFGGGPAEMLGSGRPASFNLQLMQHLQAQGGVMGDIGLELAGRITGDKYGEATEMYRRASVFYDGAGNAAAISAADFTRSKENTDLMGALFGRNQEERSAAFKTVRERFGLGETSPLIFDFGENGELASGGGRYIYHPEEISSHTGGYTNAAGKYIASDIDLATIDRLDALRLGKNSKTAMASGASEYEKALIPKLIGKDQAPLKMFSGKVQGSLRLQAKSQMSKNFFADIQQAYHNKVGISEDHYQKMLIEAGLDESEILSRMDELRRGEAAGLIARQPGTEIHRISNVQFFSMEEAIKQSVARQTAGMSTDRIMYQLWELNEKRRDAVAKSILNDRTALEEMWDNAFVGRQKRPDNLKPLKVKPNWSDKKKANVAAKNLRREQEWAKMNAQYAENEAKLYQKMDEFGFRRGRGQVNRDFNFDEIGKTRAQAALAEEIAKTHRGTGIYLPEQMEMILGADYDADQLETFIIKDRSLNERLKSRASYQNELVTGWQANEKASYQAALQELGPGASSKEVSALALQKMGDDTAFTEANRAGRNLLPEQLMAEEDFLYKTRQRALYKALKGHPPAPMHPEDVRKGSPEQLRRAAAEAEMARLEKGAIGAMTNNVDFARTVYRRQIASGAHPGTSAMADMRLFGEMLLGVLPEAPLKARQVGAGKALEIGGHVNRISDILSSNYKATMSDKVLHFGESFRALYPTAGPVIDKVASPENIQRVLEAAEAAKGQPEFDLLKKLRRPEATGSDVRAVLAALADSTIPSAQGEVFRHAVEGFGTPVMGEAERHIRNSAATFKEVYNIFKKNKGPMMIGAGVAIGASMLLGSQGSISSEEADDAGAKHQTGEPTTPPPDMMRSASVQTGGRSVRVRGTGGAVDTNAVAEKLRQRFPSANMNLSVNDYRNRINEEYIRRKIERG